MEKADVKTGRVLVAAQPFNNLLPDKVERLSLLMEEMAEVQKEIGKILRHGIDSGWSSGSGNHFNTNLQNLVKEIGHVLYAIKLLRVHGDLDMAAGVQARTSIWEEADFKAVSVIPYLHHQDYRILYVLCKKDSFKDTHLEYNGDIRDEAERI